MTPSMKISSNGNNNSYHNKLLIVDDDKATCETLSDIFEEKGYTVVSANTGNEALRKSEQDNFNVTLIDIKLPDMDGVALLREFKRLRPETVCVVITGHASLDSAINALEDGANGYFVKPFVVDEIINRIEELTDKQRLQRYLKESEERYRGLFETSKDAIISVDDKGTIIQWNEAASKIFGYRKESFIGKSIDILFPQEYNKRNTGIFHGFMDLSEHKSKDRTTISLEGVNKDGNIVPVELSESVFNKDSSTIYTGIIRDITERKRSEEKINRSYRIQSVISEALQISLAPIPVKEQLEKILDLILSIPWISLESKGCIYLVEEDSRMLVMKAQRHLSEYLQKECFHVPFGRCLCGLAALTKETIFSNHVDARHETHYHGMLSHGHYCIPILSGKTILGVINLYVKEGHKRDEREDEFLTAVANTLAGIIERSKAEKEKEHLQAQLIQSEKLSALGRITANVAHEIRNPLTSLGGFARRLYKKLSDDSKEKGYCEVIVSEVGRLEKILRGVLTYSADCCLKVESHNINDIVHEAISSFDEIMQKSELTVHYTPGSVPDVLVDKEKLIQAVSHIISNAIDSMPDGGKLTITTQKEFLNQMDYVVITVTDEGHGIDKDKLPLLFEPFYTTKAVNQFQGTGLGLSIARKIIEAHCGFINAESEPDKGSLFSIYIPFQSHDESVKKQCWQYLKCGRDCKGEKKCPAYPHYGRSCWAIAGTYCQGDLQGTYAQKLKNCKKCPFYQKAITEKGCRTI